MGIENPGQDRSNKQAMCLECYQGCKKILGPCGPSILIYFIKPFVRPKPQANKPVVCRHQGSMLRTTR